MRPHHETAEQDLEGQRQASHRTANGQQVGGSGRPIHRTNTRAMTRMMIEPVNTPI